MVSATGVRRADVVVAGEKIVTVGPDVRAPDDEVLDATGCLVIPGAVDVHTHMDMEVGATRSADDFLSGTVAAACGGTTTVIDFATAGRGEPAAQGLATWHAKARGKAVVDYGFHMTITDLTGDANDVIAEMVEAGVTSFKLYMTYPDRLMVSDEVILEVMRAAAGQGVMVSLHCEDDPIVAARRAEALAGGRTEARWHAWSRPPDAEAKAVTRAVRMAEETGAPLYIVHLSSAGALEQVRLARERGLAVFAETCPQYLYLSANRYENIPELAARFVCAPPLRDPWHQEELWEGLRSGTLQVVATDHCPFTASDKMAGVTGGGWRDFTQIPGGLPGIETRLALVYQKVTEGTLTAPQWVDRCCTTPARLFGLHPRKGVLEPGSDADVVVFDPLECRPLLPERLHMKVDYSPYEDVVVEGWPRTVLSRGRPVARNGHAVDARGWGTWLGRGPSGGAAGR